MTLELSKIAAQMNQMGQSAAKRALDQSQTLPSILERLREHRADPDLLAKAERAAKYWTVAAPLAEPLTEPLDAAFDPPAVPDRINVVATDGSQIYPDRHGIALYYMINVGSIVLRLGTGETPITDTQPILCFDREQLYGEDDYPVSGQVINARRTVAEMTRLADLAVQEAGRAPTVALADGNLALRVKQEGIPANERARLEADYMAQLSRMRGAGVLTGAFIERPSASSVVRLVHLADKCSLESVTEFVMNYKGQPYDGISDIPIFGALLKPGQRSAVFRSATQWGVPYEKRGHGIRFFYLNLSTWRQNIARVEMPEWVCSDLKRVGLLHAVIVEQCRVTANAYPYALTRADEMAVIKTHEKASLEQRIGVELLRNGIEASPSEKLATKAMARYGRRR